MPDQKPPAAESIKTEYYSSAEELYKSITKEGSLGLLALGAAGLTLWRRKRAELEAEEKKSAEKKDE